MTIKEDKLITKCWKFFEVNKDYKLSKIDAILGTTDENRDRTLKKLSTLSYLRRVQDVMEDKNISPCFQWLHQSKSRGYSFYSLEEYCILRPTIKTVKGREKGLERREPFCVFSPEQKIRFSQKKTKESLQKQWINLIDKTSRSLGLEFFSGGKGLSPGENEK